MTEKLPIASSVRPAADWDTAVDAISLTYEDRFLRRKVLTSDGGFKFLLDLPKTVSLNHGDGLLCDNGDLVEVIAASESLLQVTGKNLSRLAWHIGNRHTPCQICIDRLLIQDDHVLKSMLETLGATLTLVTEPFSPEGGAYGEGRTHGHPHTDPFGNPHEH